MAANAANSDQDQLQGSYDSGLGVKPSESVTPPVEAVPFAVLHLGAGLHAPTKHAAYRKLCKQALGRAMELLYSGRSSAEAAAEATKVLEDSPLTNAGFGSNLTERGEVECDASLIDGETFVCAAVGAVAGIRNPIMAAQAMVTDVRNLGANGTNALKASVPTVRVGPAATDFARSRGLITVDHKSMVSERAEREYKYWATATAASASVPTGEACADHPVLTHAVNDTVGVVCGDMQGYVSVATSSGGPLLSPAGRVGPAAIVGCGIALEELLDGYVVCCATGNGEDIIASQLASRCSLALRYSGDDDASAAVTSALAWFQHKRHLQSHPEPYVGLLCVSISDRRPEVNFAHTTDSMIVAAQRGRSPPLVHISSNSAVPSVLSSGFPLR